MKNTHYSCVCVNYAAKGKLLAVFVGCMLNEISLNDNYRYTQKFFLDHP
jgi:hypothetical protein